MSTATLEAPKAEKELYRYRLNRGTHIDNDPVTGKERVFKAGEIIETNQQLFKLNGGGEMMPKFEKLDDRDLPRQPSPYERQAGESAKDYAKRLAGLAAEAEKVAATEEDE